MIKYPIVINSKNIVWVNQNHWINNIINEFTLEYITADKVKLFLQFKNFKNDEMIGCEFSNCIEYTIESIDFSNILKVEIRHQTTLSIFVANKNGYNPSDFFEVLLWDRHDSIMPKFRLVTQEILIDRLVEIKNNDMAYYEFESRINNTIS